MQKASKIWIAVLTLTLIFLCVGGLRGFLHRSSADILYPLENGVTWFKRGFRDRAAPFFKAQKIIRKVESLEAEVARLRIDAEWLEQIAEENRVLRQELRLPQRVMRIPEPCEPIVWGDGLGWWRSIKINKGERDGVSAGDAVVSQDGLVGRIRTVYKNCADVELITDPNSRIACVLDLPDSPVTHRGVLQGAGWDGGTARVPSFLYQFQPLNLNYLNRDFKAGDSLPPRVPVVTSGLSGSIPGGILVGWLGETELEKDGLYKTGKVYPAVDFADLKVLFVLVRMRGKQ